MKIALLTHLRFPIAEPFAGGLESHTHYLALALKARGHAVTMYAAHGSGPGYKVVASDNSAHHLPDELQRESAIAASYNAIFDEVEAGDYDIIHNNSLNHVPMIRAGNSNLPCVHVLHTPMLPYILASAPLIKRHRNPRLIAVSQATAKTWRSTFEVDDVVYNGIDLLRWRYSSRPVPNLVAYAGRIVPEKGVHFAIDAAKLAGKDLVIAGPKSDERYFREEIEPRLDERRRYVGHLSAEDMSRLLSNAESFAFTSTWDEPFGLVMAEAMACGTPVAGFDSGAASEVVNDDTCILVPIADTQALAEAMKNVAALDRKNCRRWAATKFSRENMVAGYEAVYRDEIQQHRKARQHTFAPPRNSVGLDYKSV